MSQKHLDTVFHSFVNKGKDRVIQAPTEPFKEFLDIAEVQIGNSSGGDVAVGWGHTLPLTSWHVGQWDNDANAGDGAFTDDTADAQEPTADDVAIGTNTEVNEGALVVSEKFPHLIRLNLTTAEVGTASVTAYQYWSTTGWKTLPTLEVIDFTTTGDKYLVALKPIDADILVAGDAPVDTAGAPAGGYAVKIYFTTAAGTSAPIAGEVELVHLLDYIEKIPDGAASVQSNYPQSTHLIPPGQHLVPYIGTANNNNWILVKYGKQV